MIENQIWLDSIIQRALEEDLGAGDLTTDAIISQDAVGKAVLEAREETILAGLYVFIEVFKKIDRTIEVESFFEDGQTVPSGKNVCVVTGSLSAILKGERTALNFIQRMSGIATQTKVYIDAAGSAKARILDTRKTVPGLRLLDKYAVTMGGGSNHRLGLFDGILIKDNHIKAAGSVGKAVTLAKRKAPHTIKVEVEVEDLAGVEEAIKAGADMILLDNMAPAMMKKAVELNDGKVLFEASGGINLDNVAEVAQSGVDLISIGALTHSVRAVDLSLEII
jgi:nicotinate-nucleotide pyrophosphorylase (carboxylating)